jgi:hypothetical protein
MNMQHSNDGNKPTPESERKRADAQPAPAKSDKREGQEHGKPRDVKPNEIKGNAGKGEHSAETR